MITTDDLILLEVAPPGMEPMVRALKKKGDIDNPFAVAWANYNKSSKREKKKKKGEAAGLSGYGPLVRAKAKACMQAESNRFIWEAAEVIDAREAVVAEGKAKEGPIAKVILITEGLGNQRDMNYYGPEAIQSAPKIFEGKPMMVDHASYSEEKDIPEGRVNKTVGYYRNLRVERMADNKLACVGECHFDLSEEGLNAYQKACTAVHYKQEFPGSDQEYVGISVNAQGESEPRQMIIEGQERDVNYVMRFVAARSADMVTIPARGGAFVATVEDVAGARMKSKEVRMTIVKKLQKAQEALKEAEGLKDPADAKKKTSEARKEIELLLKEINEAARRAKEAKGKEEEEEAEDESETDPDGLGTGATSPEAEDPSAMGNEDEDENGDGDAGGDGHPDSHTVVTHKVVKKTGKAAMQKQDESARESKKLAVEALIQKSGINPKYFNVERLVAMPFKEAKEAIADKKREHAVLAEEMIEKYGLEVTPAHRSRESAGGEGGDELKPVNNSEFASLSAL